MKKNSLLKGASLLFAIALMASCGNGSTSSAPSSEDTGSSEPSSTEPEIVESEYSCRKAREAEAGAEVTVEGIVAKLTYDAYLNIDGFMLMDDFGSIYVYGPSVAVQVSIGNQVQVKGTKAYYIVSTETASAEKFGYKGSNQINATELVYDDEKTHELPTKAIEVSSVKEIVDTPCTEDISTKVYRVPAHITRVEGTGFINYYIDDLDGATGSYVYSKSGCDEFDKQSELRQYDGSTVLMYVTPINAKSTSSGCFWRFLPISVIDPAYDFPMKRVPEFALEYYVNDQFLPSYTSDPALEVVTSIDNDIIPFTGVSVSYASSNESSVYFATEGDVTKMHVGSAGSATVTANVSWNYNGETLTAHSDIDITVEEAPEIETLTVRQAIDSTDGTEVTVKGVVAGSVVNQNGYYLIDETGTIAVKTSDEISSKYSIGDEVIIKGTRSKWSKGNQSYIADAELIVNNYGNHQYSKDSFITGKTITEIAQFTTDEDHSTEVYTINAQISKVAAAYYTNYYVTDDPSGTDGALLYAASGSQYAWLDDYLSGSYDMEVVVCSWSGKTRVNMLSLTDSEGNVHYNELYF